MAKVKCDFCSDDTPEWSYPCEDFTLEAIVFSTTSEDTSTRVHHSLGEWLACWRCSALIELDDMPGLLERSLAVLSSPQDAAQPLVRTALEAWHAAFTNHRQGPRVALAMTGGI